MRIACCSGHLSCHAGPPAMYTSLPCTPPLPWTPNATHPTPPTTHAPPMHAPLPCMPPTTHVQHPCLTFPPPLPCTHFLTLMMIRSVTSARKNCSLQTGARCNRFRYRRDPVYIRFTWSPFPEGTSPRCRMSLLLYSFALACVDSCHQCQVDQCTANA